MKIKIRLEDGERELIGNLDVYFWYRNRLIQSHVVASALMALERWFYEKLENKESVDEWIKCVLDKIENGGTGSSAAPLAESIPNSSPGRSSRCSASGNSINGSFFSMLDARMIRF